MYAPHSEMPAGVRYKVELNEWFSVKSIVSFCGTVLKNSCLLCCDSLKQNIVFKQDLPSFRTFFFYIFIFWGAVRLYFGKP